MTNLRFPFLGTVSSGTHRNEDLIPDFVYTLEQVLKWAKGQPEGVFDVDLTRVIPEHEEEVRRIGARCGEEGYYASEEADHDLDYLFEALYSYSPTLIYFGASSWDRADFGFWPALDDVHHSGIETGDETPEAGEDGDEFLVINERGNCTLYRHHAGEWREVWGVA